MCSQNGKDGSEIGGGGMVRRQSHRAGRDQAAQGSASQIQCVPLGIGAE